MGSKTRTTDTLFTAPSFEVPDSILDAGINPESKFGMTKNAWDEWLRLAHVAVDFGDPMQALDLLTLLSEDNKRAGEAVVLSVLGHEYKYGVVESPDREKFLGKLGLQGFTYDHYEKTKLSFIGRNRTSPLMRATRRVITLASGSDALFSRTFQDVDGYPFAEVYWLAKKGQDHNTSRQQIEKPIISHDGQYADPLNVASKLELIKRAEEFAAKGAEHNSILDNDDLSKKIWHVSDDQVGKV